MMQPTKQPVTVRTFAIRYGIDPGECTPEGVTFWEWARHWLRGHGGPEVGSTYIKRACGAVPEPTYRQPDLLRALHAWLNRDAPGAQLQLAFTPA